MRHGDDALLSLDAVDDGQRPFASAATGAIRDGTKVGLQLAKRWNRFVEQRALAFRSFCRKKFERYDRPSRDVGVGKDIPNESHPGISYTFSVLGCSVARIKYTGCLLAVASMMLEVHAVSAQAVIEWSRERRLSKQDFQGRVPNISSASSFSWIVIDVSWGCEDGQPAAHARATFDRSRSWWRAGTSSIWQTDVGNASRSELDTRRSPAQADAQLLSHEQTHFDIAELAARRIRREFERLKEICATPEATSNMAEVIADIDRELQNEQERYDRETAHGTNVSRQRDWERRVQRDLH
jgi:hypothetical protein